MMKLRERVNDKFEGSSVELNAERKFLYRLLDETTPINVELTRDVRVRFCDVDTFELYFLNES